MTSRIDRVFALLGRPVAHSLSPRMHNAAFTAMGIRATYVALDCTAATLPALITTLTEGGGGGNVTVPHKGVAAEAVTRMVGVPPDACNTFWAEDGKAVGTNTDVDGILGAIELFHVDAEAWLIIGTGGSALAAAAAAARRGDRVAVQSRSDVRGSEFLRRAEVLGARPASLSECGLVINATPLGLGDGDHLPLRPQAVPDARFALDLVYRAGETAWVRAMRSAGVRAIDGREVLVGQGAAAFERWFPGRVAPVEIMRAAVRAGLD
ncbi:MAG TPA: FAD-binding protein [Gemmatimonadales bacterium]|nr:FAD-binding protein [Gemmatimonadales bacterium]